MGSGVLAGTLPKKQGGLLIAQWEITRMLTMNDPLIPHDTPSEEIR